MSELSLFIIAGCIGVWFGIAFRIILHFYDEWQDKKRAERIDKILEEHYKKYPQYRNHGGVPAYPLSHEVDSNENI